MRTQGHEAKKTRQAYGLFALLALVIAMVNLLVLGVKLDKKDTAAATAGTSQPAGASAPAQAGPLAHTEPHDAQGILGCAQALRGGRGPRSFQGP